MQDDHIKDEEPVKKEEVKAVPALATSPVLSKKDGKDAAGPKAEQRTEGAVTLSTYTTYGKAGGGWCGVFVMCVLLLVAPTALIISGTLYITNLLLTPNAPRSADIYLVLLL
jgi:hypothetical protein